MAKGLMQYGLHNIIPHGFGKSGPYSGLVGHIDCVNECYFVFGHTIGQLEAAACEDFKLGSRARGHVSSMWLLATPLLASMFRTSGPALNLGCCAAIRMRR